MADIFDHKATSEDFDKFADFIDKGNYNYLREVRR